MFLFLAITAQYAVAQCAMCKATVENNVSSGETLFAENLNQGILYLFAAPYLAIAIIGYFWYKSSKANAARNRHRERHYQS